MKYNSIFLNFPHYRVVVDRKNVLKWIIFHYHASPLSVMSAMRKFVRGKPGNTYPETSVVNLAHCPTHTVTTTRPTAVDLIHKT